MKLNIRKKLVTLAVASAVSGGAMMAAAPAQAMNVSQNGVGQVLLFPYYTVKNGFDTVLTVTNTSDKTAVIKIRWREALNSREVRDFNVVLSPKDLWSGAVTATADGAMFRTYDKSCTSPLLPGMVSAADRAAAGSKGEIAFSNVLYSGTFADGGGASMDRVKEGYFEVFLMGVSDRLTNLPANTLEYNAKHVAGVPRDCAAVDALFLNSSAINAYMTAPENILRGGVFYLNTANGTAIDAKPTAIENFQTTQPIVFSPSDLAPNLTSGDAAPIDIFYLNDGSPTGASIGVGASGSASLDAVSGLLTAESVINEFATGGVASTSWVVTFPTKHHYTDGVGPFPPFSDRFQTDGLSCDNIGMSLYNREEGTVVSVDNTQFSPYNPSSPTVSLCYEANVVDFNASSVFGAGTNRLAVDTSGVGDAGWAQLYFVEDTADVIGLNSLSGLPVIGFAAALRTSGDATVNYGVNAEHVYVRNVVDIANEGNNQNQNQNQNQASQP